MVRGRTVRSVNHRPANAIVLLEHHFYMNYFHRMVIFYLFLECIDEANKKASSKMLSHKGGNKKCQSS